MSGAERFRIEARRLCMPESKPPSSLLTRQSQHWKIPFQIHPLMKKKMMRVMMEIDTSAVPNPPE